VAVGLILCVAALTAPAGLLSAPAEAAARAGYPARVRQLITVTAASHSATSVILRAYRITHGHTVRVFGPWVARVGYNGIAPPGKKREGDGRTPAGTYGFSFLFGVRPNAGFAFPYRHAYRYDFWDDDPNSGRYNEWVDARKHNPGKRPEPMHQVPAYEYAAVITYNARRVPGLGSAIFLHVGTGTATAGCVSLPRSELLKVLRWLKPRDHPQISISVR
jgi:L,D-peptidoglycan transpeptidase YkuD (ErfK/YbiS/YcfS/YnhG family)